MFYPRKVEQALRLIERSWDRVTVEQVNSDDNGALWAIRARKGGDNVFIREDLSVYVSTSKRRTIGNTGITMKASQRFMGGHILRFGGDRDIVTWRDLDWATRKLEGAE